MPFRSFRSVLNNFKCFGAGKARAFLLRPFPAASRRTPRARLSPRAKEQAMPALRRPLPAFPSPVKCRRCPPRPPAFRALRRRQIFCPPFPRAGCFLFVLLQMRVHSSVPRRMRGRKAGQMRRGACVFPPLRPFSHCLKGLPPLFRTAKIILSLPPSFVAAQKTVFAEQSPLSESAASKNTTAEPAAQTHIFRRTKAKRPAPHFRAAQGALKNSDEASADSCGRPRRKILRAPQHAAPASFFINT